MSAVLGLAGFDYDYPGPRPGLRDVSLRVEAGEFVVVAGRSGSGKSTLLRAAAGLVPHHFGGRAGGEAAICGRDLRTHRTAELAEFCGYVMQDPESQVVMGSVRHEIAFPLENLGWSRPRIDTAVAEIAAALEIGHLLGRRTGELSGGELQRVVLAAALAPRPPLLALDEPTAQLDPRSASEFYAALDRIRAARGTAVLIAEHRLEPALSRATRAIAIDAGEVVFDGSPGALLDWAAADPRGEPIWPASVRPYPRASDAETAGPQGAPADSSDPATGPVVLSLDRVEYVHRGATRPALRGASLTLRAGEGVALTGANGSGKSTLLRLARGLIEPSAGTRRAAGEIGLLLQNPNDYLIHDRVGDEAPAEALARFGLDSLAGLDPRELSGGQRQRLAMAIVMQRRPAVLLLDEPTRGMDRERKLDLLDLLAAVRRAGTAVLLATHDAAMAEAFADRVVRIEDGVIVDSVPALEAVA